MYGFVASCLRLPFPLRVIPTLDFFRFRVDDVQSTKVVLVSDGRVTKRARDRWGPLVRPISPAWLNERRKYRRLTSVNQQRFLAVKLSSGFYLYSLVAVSVWVVTEVSFVVQKWTKERFRSITWKGLEKRLFLRRCFFVENSVLLAPKELLTRCGLKAFEGILHQYFFT